MKIFLKAVVIDRGRDIPLQVVSVGMVTEDGHEFYAINGECLSNVSRDPYLAITAVPMLPINFDQNFGFQSIVEWDREQVDYSRVMPLDALADQARDFITATESAEIWGWNGSFDYVALIQLFGKRAEMPAGIPGTYRELVQLWEYLERPELPAPPADVHALKEAAWARDAYVWMTDPSEELRHERAIAIVGHPDSGKTTLRYAAEAIAPSAVPKLGHLPPDGAVINIWDGDIVEDLAEFEDPKETKE